MVRGAPARLPAAHRGRTGGRPGPSRLARAAPRAQCRGGRTAAASPGSTSLRRLGLVGGGQLVCAGAPDPRDEQTARDHRCAVRQSRARFEFSAPYAVGETAVAAAARGLGDECKPGERRGRLSSRPPCCSSIVRCSTCRTARRSATWSKPTPAMCSPSPAPQEQRPRHAAEPVRGPAAGAGPGRAARCARRHEHGDGEHPAGARLFAHRRHPRGRRTLHPAAAAARVRRCSARRATWS